MVLPCYSLDRLPGGLRPKMPAGYVALAVKE